MEPADAPLITCVMIFLNAEKYFVEAIESVRAQTYPHWELILVDDGSTDASTAIARDYAARYPETIRYVEHPGHANRGMSASRNAGVAAGRGRFVSFLDSDDIWLPERLDHFVDVARRFPEAGMIYGPTLYWYSWRPVADRPKDWPEDFPGELGMPTDVQVSAPEALRQFLLSGGGNLPGICSLLIRADAYRDIGGFEPDFRGLYEDQVFLSKITYHHAVVVIDEILDHYRQHDDSCCHRSIKTREYHPEDYHPTRARYLRWLAAYLKAQPQADAAIVEAVRVQLRPYDIPLYAASANFRARCLRKAAHLRERLRSDPRAEPLRRVWYGFKRVVLRRKQQQPAPVPVNPATPPG